MYGQGENKKKLIIIEKPKKNKKKKTEEIESVISISSQPELLLRSVFFLNLECTKNISIGYAIADNCRPMFMLSHDLSYVLLALTDWMVIFLSNLLIQNWYAQVVDVNTNDSCVVSKNIKLKRVMINGVPLIEIENVPKKSFNNSVLINLREYERCCELDSYLQYLFRQAQQNWIYVDDYYNMYVYYCLLKNKPYLDEEDYFTIIDLPQSIDSYKIYKEISLVCKEKLSVDVRVCVE